MLFLLVRKSAKAKNMETQLQMLTKDIFNIVYGSEKHMKKQLLDDGFVFSLQNPGHKWRFLTGGNYEIFYYGSSDEIKICLKLHN